MHVPYIDYLFLAGLSTRIPVIGLWGTYCSHSPRYEPFDMIHTFPLKHDDHSKNGQGAAIGFVATGGGVGAFAFPFFMAAISDRFGIQRGFIFYKG
ncbi:hypothetical protein ACFL6S_16800 [Candidatus Poribacteria bacterium]